MSANNIKLVQHGMLYTVRLKNRELLKAIFYHYFRSPIFTEPSVYEPTTVPSFRLPSYTEHEDCFVSGNRIINSKEIDAILIDNIWHLFIEKTLK